MKQINDRFTFDSLFRKLLKAGIDRTEAIKYILSRHSLSLIVFQERIENKYYQKIKPDEKISPDLLQLKEEILKREFLKKLHHYI